MLDEQFRGTIYLIVNVLGPSRVIEPGKEVCDVGMAEWPMPLAEGMRQASPHVDLDHFKGFREQIAKHNVEGVSAGDVVESHARKKGVPLLLKRKAVAAEPVVVDVRQKPFGVGRIGNGQATLNQPDNLVGVRKPGFLVGWEIWGRLLAHAAASPESAGKSQQKNPSLMHITSVRREGCDGCDVESISDGSTIGKRQKRKFGEVTSTIVRNGLTASP